MKNKADYNYVHNKTQYKNLHIDALELSGKCRNSLISNNIINVYQLLEAHNNKFENCINFGPKSIAEVQKLLDNDYLDNVLDLVENKIEFSDDYIEKIRKIFFNILEHNRSAEKNKNIEILSLRANGYSLHRCGNLFGLSRERIRQIELLYQNRFNRYAEFGVFKILIDKLLNNRKYIRKNDFAIYIPQYTNIFIYLVINFFEYSYIKELDVYLAENLRSVIDKYFEQLPEFFPIKKREEFIEKTYNSIKENEEQVIEFDIVEKYFDLTYLIFDDLYSREKFLKTDRAKIVLKKFFPEGIKIYNKIALERFRKAYFSLFGKVDGVYEDRNIMSHIQHSCYLVDRGVYSAFKPENISLEFIQDIKEFINSREHNALDINEVFQYFKKRFLEIGVTNKTKCYTVIKESFGQDDEFKFSKCYVYKKDKKTKFPYYLGEYIKSFNRVVQYQEIRDHFKDVSVNIINLGLNTCDVVLYHFKSYVHISRIIISEEEKKSVKKFLHDLLKVGFLESKVLYKAFNKQFKEIIERNEIENSFYLFSIMSSLYADDFIFKRPYIFKQNAKVTDKNEILYTYITKFDKISILDIRDYARQNSVRIDNIRIFIYGIKYGMFFADKNHLAKISYLEVNEEHAQIIEKEIINYFKKSNLECCYLKDINLNNTLPKIKVPWNEWLMYSILSKWGKTVKLALASNAIIHQEVIVYINNPSLDYLKIY